MAERVRGIAARRLVLPLVTIVLGIGAVPGVWAEPGRGLNVCRGITYDGEDAFAAGKGYFNFFEGCARVSGWVGLYHQNTLSTSVGGFPALTSSDGTPSNARYSNTLSASVTLENKYMTGAGELASSITGAWSKTLADGSGVPEPTISGVEASLAGWTVGYTSSLMNFWSGDFQSSATAPQRTVGIVSYERTIFARTKLALALESGLPSSRERAEGIRGLEFDSPIYSARLTYEDDNSLKLHLSGIVRRAEFPANPAIPFLPATATTRTGWAASFGATVPLPALGEDDAFSMQATYAVDASPFLGTGMDLSTLAAIVPTTGPTRGWSVVASYTHAWSAQWQSNVFASYLALDAKLIGAQPSVQTTRAGVNLYWKPIKEFRVGAELGFVDFQLSNSGAVGFLRGGSGRATVGYLAAEWTF